MNHTMTALNKSYHSLLLTIPTSRIQLVSVDDDLLCELDALDASGLSLLHYCCMYNLTVLVLVLLNR
jgi:hypothetical protein